MTEEYLHTSSSPLNKSPSKQLYSFPKAVRFAPTPPPLSKNTFYEIKKGAMEKRTTTLGYGNKVDFVNRQKIPPVGNYQHSDQFLNNKSKSRGYAFGNTSKSNTLVNPEKSRKLPGPGAYYRKEMSLKVQKYPTLSYSMRDKTDDPLQKHQNELGPGQYETISGTTPTGKYYISRFANSACRKIGREKRAELAKRSQTPGPGSYRGEKSLNMNDTGVYFNSKVRNMEGNRFAKCERPEPGESKKVPGPGSYTTFTEFGKINKSWMKN